MFGSKEVEEKVEEEEIAIVPQISSAMCAMLLKDVNDIIADRSTPSSLKPVLKEAQVLCY
jgi:hypothetical protein